MAEIYWFTQKDFPVTEHYTRATVSAAAYCSKCGKSTQHRIDDKRKGPCLECIARLDLDHGKREHQAKQKSLFEEST